MYDPDTGKVYWKVDAGNNIKAGNEAGSLMPHGRNLYRQISIDGRKYLAHRVAWLLRYGDFPVGPVDHIDGNGLNNRPENMKDATNQENRKNQRMYRNNTSGVTGVTWDKLSGKWKAQISVSGKRKHLGYFISVEIAATAYRKAADEFGFTDRHGK